MKKCIFLLFYFFLLCSTLSIVLYNVLKEEIFLTLAITFCTTFFHFAFRLLIGLIFNHDYNKALKNFYDYKKPWFKEKPFEKKLYKFLKVKQWKNHMPTYSPETFDLQKHSVEQIITSTCQAEFIHELNAVLSFLPLFASIWFGQFYVFLFTSVAASIYELMFVIIQRFNRPRLIYFSHINK